MRAKVISDLFEENSDIAWLCLYIEAEGKCDSDTFCEIRGITLEKFYKLIEKTPIFQKVESKKGASCTVRFLDSFENKWVKDTLHGDLGKREFTMTCISINEELSEYSIFRAICMDWKINVSQDTFYECRRIYFKLKYCQEIVDNMQIS